MRAVTLSGDLPKPVRERRPRAPRVEPVAAGPEITQFGHLVGHTLARVQGAAGDEELVFTLADGRRFKLYHDQDCCESVSIGDIAGDLASLVGEPLLFADESSSNQDSGGDSTTWTFYRLGTIKGGVVVRWIGSSNGYYSESVYFGKA